MLARRADHYLTLRADRFRVERTHATIPAFGVGIVADEGGIALLKVLLPGRLDIHLALGFIRRRGGLAAGRSSSVYLGHDGFGRRGK